MNTFTVPDFCLVVLIGAQRDARAAFAAAHFRPDEVVRRGEYTVTDADAPVAGGVSLHQVVARRLRDRRLVVVDDHNLRIQDRQPHVEVAHHFHALPVAIVLGDEASFPHLSREGFRRIFRPAGAQPIGDVRLRRQPLDNDRRVELGPFDIIGDVHGCADELEALLERLGYTSRQSGHGSERHIRPPAGRKAVFVGDLVDRGPRIADVLRLVMGMVADGSALCVMGNHDHKLLRWLDGHKVRVSHGLDASIEQLEAQPPGFRDDVRTFLAGLADHYWLDQGRLCVAHAGLDESRIGRASGAVRAFALYGDTTGERDEHGLPVRLDWAARYRGDIHVVYGHTPVVEPVWRNRTLCLDTGCVFGGALTALRYPEDELVTVPAREVYFESLRPFTAVAAV